VAQARCLPHVSLMLACAEESHSQQRSIGIQNHLLCAQSQSQMEGWESSIHIANIHAAPKCEETGNRIN
jgi:hypothetical protein